MSGPIVDFYWDTGSTNTYFAFKLLAPILAKYGASLRLHPFNLGHVFRHHNYVLMEEPATKISNRIRDLERWALKHDLPFRVPDTFPIKTSRALRGSIAMRHWNLERDYVEAVMTAYWERNDASIAEYSGLRRIAAELGVDPAAFEARSESEEVRQALIDSTNAGLARGVFGVPIMAVGDELFWGKDRMDFVEDALLGTYQGAR